MALTFAVVIILVPSLIGIPEKNFVMELVHRTLLVGHVRIGYAPKVHATLINAKIACEYDIEDE